MKIFGITDKGLVRDKNEDRYFIRQFADDHALVAVMDGLGGQPGGELATVLVEEVLAGYTPQSGAVGVQLNGLVEEGNRKLEKAEKEDPKLYGMGCTLIAALVQAGTVNWVHVGDSRLYHFNGTLRQITTDHNMAQFLYEEGELSLQEAMQSPMQNLMDQCMGGSFMEHDQASFKIEPGDLLLLCTDGIHGVLMPDTISAILAIGGGVEARARKLVQAALQAGGPDNITAIVLEC